MCGCTLEFNDGENSATCKQCGAIHCFTNVDNKSKKNKIIIIIAAVICAIIAFAIVLNTVIIPNKKYNDAIALMNDGKYKEAISAFEKLDGYKDSESKISECNAIIIDRQYNLAISLIDEGKYTKAYEELVALNGYKDSIAKADSIYKEYMAEKIKSTQAGDYIKFGSYEQDNNKENGKEEIEWLVLNNGHHQLLLISKYGLVPMSYEFPCMGGTWENSEIRDWLNNDFLNSAFSESQKKLISTTTITTKINPPYDTVLNDTTQDKIFMLSTAEANRYFTSDSERQCKPTEYAIVQGACVNKKSGNCRWLLRSPGNLSLGSAYVEYNGDINDKGDVCRPYGELVRPVLWIDTKNAE